MASTTTFRLPFDAKNPWCEIVRAALRWGEPTAWSWRDAVLLVPFAQHLAPARSAWSATGTWMPRIETTQTLARSLGPADAPSVGQLTFTAAVDRLTARRMLRGQSWAAAWLRDDPRAFEQAVSSLVQAAQAFARGAAAVSPDVRVEHWSRGRTLLGALAGPGASERALAGMAFEWAAASARPVTDVLFDCRPAAWVVVQAGGVDRLSARVLEGAPSATPCLVIDTDVDTADPYAGWSATRPVQVAVCVDFEDEAQRAAAQVLSDLESGLQPVALVAQDRLLTRRIRALLARHDVPLHDETGWKLSTTRAAATVMSLLRAARRDASTDDRLDWLKNSGSGWPAHGGDAAAAARALDRLERDLRQHRWAHPASVRVEKLADNAARLWLAASDLVERLRGARRQPLSAWLGLTDAALAVCGALPALRADEAGRQVLAALQLGEAPLTGPWLAADDPMGLDDFSSWVGAVLEEGSYLPAAVGGAPVVVLPLERAMLRSFGAVVLPAADDRHLGAVPMPQPLLGDALAGELGAATVGERRDAETLAFGQVLRVPKLTLLRRLDDAGEALAASPLLARLALAARRRGIALPAAADPRLRVALSPLPIARPVPSAATLLPARLSASACEALRTCPYRFFALRLLRLREDEELEDEFEKRDYGTWLHAVLHRFHASRSAPGAAADEAARLHAIADEVEREMGFDAAAFLPFDASFARFVPRYVEWLHGRDAAGARWVAGEVELVARPAAWAGVEMYGIVDRVDRLAEAGGTASTQLIDYKTGSAQTLKDVLKTPLEDTQLAFYAALMASAQTAEGGPVAAIYLPLDERGEIKPIEHREVEASARRLVAGIGEELAQIRSGAPLAALGEGRACTYCAARGLCRRDQWPPSEATA